MAISRRDFVLTTAHGASGLLLGISLRPAPGSAATSPTQLNSWLEIPSQAEPIFVMGATEMGQGSLTGLAAILCEELDYPVATMNYRLAPANRVYKHPEFMFQVTGGSSSITSWFDELSHLGAAARQLLMQAAARQAKVPLSSLRTNLGTVLLPNGGALRYQELAAATAGLSPGNYSLKARADYKYIGKVQKRLDSVPKVTGAAAYGIDAEMPDAVAALILHSPVVGDSPASFDDTAARSLPAYIRCVLLPTGIAVVCQTYGDCLKAQTLVQITWKGEGHPSFNTSAYLSELRQSATASQTLKLSGASEKLVSATYSVPYLTHAALEPLNATAWYHPEQKSIQIITSTQAPGMIRSSVAQALDLEEAQVSVETTFVGGGFGRRLEVDFAIEAALLARELSTPVRMLWTREEDMLRGYFRPAAAAHFAATLNSAGMIQEWQNTLVTQALSARVIASFVGAMSPNWLPDSLRSGLSHVAAALTGGLLESEGLKTIPYAVKDFDMNWTEAKSPVPVGSWRSVGHSMNGFFVESFMDELALAATLDPLEFRRRHLQRPETARNLAVLEAVAQLSNWQEPAGRHLGLACHESFKSIAALVLEVEVEGDEIRVRRAWCAIDCGLAVFPEGVRTQIEGGIIFGLSAALYGHIEFVNGVVQERNFDSYPILRMDACPQIETLIVNSDGPLGGVGEPAVPLVGPALANAVFRATGKRYRDLPLRL